MKANSQTSTYTKSQEYSIDEIKELLEIKVLLPENNDNFFKDMIGNENVKNYFLQIIKLLKSGEKIEVFGELFNPAFWLLGIEGIGKALTVFSFASEMSLPIIVIDTEKLLQDFSNKIIQGIKKVISQFETCVVFFKDVNYACQLDGDKQTSLYSKICNIKNSFPNSYFFASSSETATYPAFFYSSEGFDTRIIYTSPNHEERILIIKNVMKDLPHESKIDYEKISKDLFGSSYGEIRDMISKSWIQCLITGQQKLTYEIINQTIYSENFGNKIRKMSEVEMRLTAYHEAGHVIAGYYGCPNYKVSKVEVVFRAKSLGLTDPEQDDDKLSYTREDIIGNIITCLGGKAAEQAVFNTSTSGVAQDLAQATTWAESYIKFFGMDPSMGPICLQDDTSYACPFTQTRSRYHKNHNGT